MIYILKIQHFGETSLTYNSVGALSSLFTIFLINKSKKKKLSNKSYNWGPSFNFVYQLKRKNKSYGCRFVDRCPGIFYTPPSLCHILRYCYKWIRFRLL